MITKAICMCGNDESLRRLILAFKPKGIELINKDYQLDQDIIEVLMHDPDIEALLVVEQTTLGLEGGKYGLIEKIREHDSTVRIIICSSTDIIDKKFTNWCYGHGVYDIFYPKKEQYDIALIAEAIKNGRLPTSNANGKGDKANQSNGNSAGSGLFRKKPDPDYPQLKKPKQQIIEPNDILPEPKPKREKKEKSLKVPKEQIPKKPKGLKPFLDMKPAFTPVKPPVTTAEMPIMSENVFASIEPVTTVSAQPNVAEIINPLEIETNNLYDLPVEVVREVEVIKEVPVEVVKEVEVIKEVPVEVVREVEVVKEVPVPYEVVKEVPVPHEVIKKVEVPVYISKRAGTYIIGVFNISHGAGATSMAYALASELHKTDEKVALLEVDNKADISLAKGKFPRIVSATTEEALRNLQLYSISDYSFIVVDFGSIFNINSKGKLVDDHLSEKKQLINEFFRCHLHIGMGFSASWHASKLTFFNDKDNSLISDQFRNNLIVILDNEISRSKFSNLQLYNREQATANMLVKTYLGQEPKRRRNMGLLLF